MCRLISDGPCKPCMTRRRTICVWTITGLPPGQPWRRMMSPGLRRICKRSDCAIASRQREDPMASLLLSNRAVALALGADEVVPASELLANLDLSLLAIYAIISDPLDAPLEYGERLRRELSS